MPTLFDKIYGVEAATAIANSMGDVTEGLSWQEIEERYGFMTELLPQPGKFAGSPVRKMDRGYDFVRHEHDRPAGMTEDGHERYRLAVTAIIEKGGRITIEDLARIWLRDIDPDKFGYLLGPQDQVIYYSLKAGVPPWEVGRHAAWPAMIGTSKMMIAIGVVNACNPAQAAQDALEIGRIKDIRGARDNYALEVAAAIAAGTAEALKADATVDSIVQTALDQLTSEPRDEVQRGLDWAGKVSDWRDLRPLYAEEYRGRRASNAVEVLSGAAANFVLCDGHVEDAILQCCNFGRESDCRAYVAGGWAGALRGIAEVPTRWLDVVTEEVKTDPYTVSRRTPEESAQGLYQAVLGNLRQLKEQIDLIEQQLVPEDVRP